jgi:hypothetical protein
MTAIRFLLLMAVTIFSAPLTARADAPVAMVEEAGAKSTLAPFDYLSPGQSIALGAHERIVIDYFASCTRETITGGTVTIGNEQSAVAKGEVRREHVACDGGHLAAASGRGDDSAAVVFRKAPGPADAKAKAKADSAHVTRKIYARCPVVNLTGSDSVSIERIDAPEAPVSLAVAPDQLRHGFYDFANGPCEFVAGGTYRLTAGTHSLFFTIDPGARRATGPLAGRLLFM